MQSFLAAFQPNLDRLVRILSFVETDWFVSGIISLRGLLQFVNSHSRARPDGDARLLRKRLGELPAVDENGAGYAHQKNVQADAYSRPQVNLEERLTQPEALRPMQPFFPGAHLALPTKDVSRHNQKCTAYDISPTGEESFPPM